ncbi:hypothetical protein ISF_04619 [Cordyceps fumosorosea ARSEF 2679]|uniref:Uncharacterized protein n=1 Tax=Cordyceps fumosorosea (strain ARSEF 2679) TaxID=1081104 RepID=A0A162MLX1_CORFA|nr:hypothetical protein ISF_04619 [Cordyceps fumosorosea ARSEF 2679]OAA63910.1 hypothetical protein ISF_04619 [Cordyceps fumosorosea ARSEF 2679]
MPHVSVYRISEETTTPEPEVVPDDRDMPTALKIARDVAKTEPLLKMATDSSYPPRERRGYLISAKCIYKLAWLYIGDDTKSAEDENPNLRDWGAKIIDVELRVDRECPES